jgi:hypothetical protein
MQDEQDTLIETVTVNEEENSLSFIDHLHANILYMTDAEIMDGLRMEIAFIDEFEPYRQDYLQRIELVMWMYSQTGNKDFIHLLF